MAREVAWLLKKVRTGNEYDRNALYETLEELIKWDLHRNWRLLSITTESVIFRIVHIHLKSKHLFIDYCESGSKLVEDQAPPLGVPGGPAVGDDSHAVLGSDMTELTGSVETGDHFGFFLIFIFL